MELSKPLHPFPARMSPDIALRSVIRLPNGATVLDPMSGSGTVLRVASDHGHKAIGFDVDPLSVLLGKVWTTPINTELLTRTAKRVVYRAIGLSLDETYLPWIDEDHETRNFVRYWFAQKQQNSLRKLCTVLANERGPIANALKLAVSRLIITKSGGASLAADVSHSRPHRVRDTNDFRVFDEFLRTVDKLTKVLDKEPPRLAASIRRGDARRMTLIASGSVDSIVTSPPYLNAIDYLRGHRLALVWLGYSVGRLRRIRSNSVGAERAPSSETNRELIRDLLRGVADLHRLPPAKQKMIERYALDVYAMLAETKRVLKPNRAAVYVIGNSCLRGVFVRNTKIVLNAAKKVGLNPGATRERELPPSKRYLPPPTLSRGELSTRMRTEAILTLHKRKS